MQFPAKTWSVNNNNNANNNVNANENDNQNHYYYDSHKKKGVGGAFLGAWPMSIPTSIKNFFLNNFPKIPTTYKHITYKTKSSPKIKSQIPPILPSNPAL